LLKIALASTMPTILIRTVLEAPISLQRMSTSRKDPGPGEIFLEQHPSLRCKLGEAEHGGGHVDEAIVAMDSYSSRSCHSGHVPGR
jgi:hypothetical protein